ncbi:MULTISPECIES: hypothetical protein [unclassified Coleofasciculus]|nr:MULTISPECIES: hypothetical protein [unclassified Coleofasciculus]
MTPNSAPGPIPVSIVPVSLGILLPLAPACGSGRLPLEITG